MPQNLQYNFPSPPAIPRNPILPGETRVLSHVLSSCGKFEFFVTHPIPMRQPRPYFKSLWPLFSGFLGTSMCHGRLGWSVSECPIEKTALMQDRSVAIDLDSKPRRFGEITGHTIASKIGCCVRMGIAKSHDSSSSPEAYVCHRALL